MKAVRFAQVVARSGRPHVHTLWIAPGKDAELARALKAQRVMTVRSPRGKTDVGEIGFAPKTARDDAPFQLLIFPKSLARFADARVVGIKFDLVAQPKLVAATASPPASSAMRRKRLGGGAGSPSQPGFERRWKAHDANRPETQAGSESRPHRGRTPPSPRSAHRTGENALRGAVRRALQELERGKAVAAYQRLQRALKK